MHSLECTQKNFGWWTTALLLQMKRYFFLHSKKKKNLFRCYYSMETSKSVQACKRSIATGRKTDSKLPTYKPRNCEGKLALGSDKETVYESHVKRDGKGEVIGRYRWKKNKEITPSKQTSVIQYSSPPKKKSGKSLKLNEEEAARLLQEFYSPRKQTSTPRKRALTPLKWSDIRANMKRKQAALAAAEAERASGSRRSASGSRRSASGSRRSASGARRSASGPKKAAKKAAKAITASEQKRRKRERELAKLA